MKITVIDSGFGNLYSIANAIRYIGYEVCITSKAEDIISAKRIILPGVGAFGNGMSCLNERSLTEPLTLATLERKIPFLGICLGMQLIGSKSSESDNVKGLGWIRAKTTRIRTVTERLPHMGFNTVVKGINHDVEGKDYYFVHSYCVELEQEVENKWYVDYGGKILAGLSHGNINAVQFHPEKSQANGLDLLRYFFEEGSIKNG